MCCLIYTIELPTDSGIKAPEKMVKWGDRLKTRELIESLFQENYSPSPHQISSPAKSDSSYSSPTQQALRYICPREDNIRCLGQETVCRERGEFLILKTRRLTEILNTKC